MHSMSSIASIHLFFILTKQPNNGILSALKTLGYILFSVLIWHGIHALWKQYVTSERSIDDIVIVTPMLWLYMIIFVVILHMHENTWQMPFAMTFVVLPLLVAVYACHLLVLYKTK